MTDSEKRERKSERLQSLRLARKNKVPKDPTVNEMHVAVQVRHKDKGSFEEDSNIVIV